MPLLKLHTNISLTDDKKNELVSQLSKLVVKQIGKPEQYVMVLVQDALMSMSGSKNDAVLIEVKSIGALSAEVNAEFTKAVCELLQKFLGIIPVRVYVHFENVSGENWGWNSRVFGV